MSSSSTSTPTQPDAVSLVLEINRLLLQHTLSLDQGQHSLNHDEVQAARKECLLRLNANLAFLAACADPKNRAKARLTLLSPPKHVEVVGEQYAKLSAMLTRASPRQMVTSPNHYADPSIAAYNNTKALQTRTSQSPRNGLMSPPAIIPPQMFQQQIQQQPQTQKQSHKQGPSPIQQQQSHNIPRHMVQQQQIHSPVQSHPSQQQNMLRQQMQQRTHMQQQQQQQQMQQQQQQQHHHLQQAQLPLRTSQSPVSMNGNGYNAQHIPSPQVSQQYANPYRQEQIRQQQMNKMAAYPQSNSITPIPPPQQHSPAPQQQMYMQTPVQQQIAMANMAQQQHQQQQSMQQQMPFIPQQYQQPHQGRMPYYPTNGQTYM